MKKLLFLLSAGSLLLTYSCNDDDDSIPANQSDIVGTWKMEKIEVISGDDNSVLDSDAITGCYTNNTYVYAADNTLSFKYFDEDTGTCALDSEDTGTYSINNLTLSMEYSDGSTEVSELKLLTDTHMQVLGDEFDYDGDNFIDQQVVYLYKQ